ncbi:DJ-1/PfpI family protein [Nocardiopsis suaedae]|uniref:DJ-1/PfpI family protein n=1 Tax=Nocardiopsis suaedae TaxID=3018444 RepID=A0ABT4TK06_9ACTN|nr:DJ-1/PfpI family protein [Nocardiopsis suaedae]MDA2805038.1 DJ-1/PfpI family protein [Nocardiopsis suaedae]
MTNGTVHLAVYDTLADWETGYLTPHLRNGLAHKRPGGSRVTTVGLTTDPVTTMGGVRILPDTALADLDPADSALLVLPGASAWDTDADRLAPFTRTARAFLDAGVPVAAICGATAGLAREGLLDERPHTSNAPDYLAATGYAGAAHYRDEPAVTGGDVVTAGATAPIAFAREVFARLDVFEPDVLDAWYRLFAHEDTSAFEVLQRAAGATEGV